MGLVKLELEFLKGKITWSMVKVYMICAYMCYLDETHFIEHRVETEEMKQGKMFHWFAKKLFDKFKIAPTVVEAMEFIHSYTMDPDQVKWLIMFIEFEYERYKHCKESKLPWKPEFLEHEFEDDYITAIVDRMERNGIDDENKIGYTLIELKRRPSPWDMKQLSFYHLLLTSLGYYINRWAVYYQVEPEKNRYHKPRLQSINSMKRKLSLIYPSIIAGRFIATPGFHCGGCKYKFEEICDFKGLSFNLCVNCGGETL